MVKITITKGDPTTGVLTFDGDTLKGDREAGHREEVEWHLGDGCGVKAILSIFPKPSTPTDPSIDIWDVRPHKTALSENWKGRVNDKAPHHSRWHYGIWWEEMNGQTAPVFDPKIIVNTARR